MSDEGKERKDKLYGLLVRHRDSMGGRKPKAGGIDEILEDIAIQCPVDDNGLLEIAKVGPSKASVWGDAWLDIVNKFNARRTAALLIRKPETTSRASAVIDLTSDDGGVYIKGGGNATESARSMPLLRKRKLPLTDAGPNSSKRIHPFFATKLH
ncbi:Uu.00g061460.m01.CDS01 [Anthostomella pinea]|uniref:Uu.00g061460.m01.CDS01 n=1 Tax=Anthostomella pinea TaxID=933095 RepID=A0AAI8YK53_9PEZI|nr:Uu.00g061460.m01.CDS01 [Anthostomella pinea]